MNRLASAAGMLVVGVTLLSGCEAGSTPRSAKVAATGQQGTAGDIAAERAKLSPEDRALVDAQEWCVVQNDERLGSMGPPIKLNIKGQPIFLCCNGCQKTAERDPDATIAKLEELKAKARAEKGQKN